METHQADKKYLVYEGQTEQPDGVEGSALHSANHLWFWSDRIALTEGEHTKKLWQFQAVDLLTNEARPISFPKSGSHFIWVCVVSLVKNYGFIVENSNEHYQFNLVKIHWETNKIQVFEQFKRRDENGMNILVDQLQPLKFVLNLDDTYEVCTLNGGKIEFYDMHTINRYFDHYFNDKLYWFDDDIFEICAYDLLLKNTQSFQIEALAGYDVDRWSFEWIKNRVYVVAKSHGENEFGIAWTDSETKRLTLIDITTAMPIQKLKFLGGNLIAYGKESNEQNGILKSAVKVHSVPIHRLHSLRQMSWLIVVQQMKNSGKIDPYKEASRYLPFNTDLRAPWFTDEAADSQENLDQSKNESIQDGIPSKRYKPN